MTLYERWQALCLTFAKKCLNNEANFQEFPGHFFQDTLYIPPLHLLLLVANKQANPNVDGIAIYLFSPKVSEKSTSGCF